MNNTPSLLSTERSTLMDSEAFWEKHIQGIEGSGLSRAAYCQQHNLPQYRLRYWHRKLCRPQASRLIPVKVVPRSAPPVDETSLCSLELSRGHCLKITSEAGLLMLLREVLS